MKKGEKKADLAAYRGRNLDRGTQLEVPENKDKNKDAATLGIQAVNPKLDRKWIRDRLSKDSTVQVAIDPEEQQNAETIHVQKKRAQSSHSSMNYKGTHRNNHHLLPRPPSCRTAQPITSRHSTTIRVRILQAFRPISAYEGFSTSLFVLLYSARWELSVFLIFTSEEAFFEASLLIPFRNLEGDFLSRIANSPPHQSWGFCQHIVLAAGSPSRFVFLFLTCRHLPTYRKTRQGSDFQRACFVLALLCFAYVVACFSANRACSPKSFLTFIFIDKI